MKRIKFTLLLCLISAAIFSQEDKVTFHNDNVIIGEVKGMVQGILLIETDYSDDDFAIEWDEIKTISTQTHFLITLSDGIRYSGKINSENKKIDIITIDDSTISVLPDEIVFMESVEQSFWSNINASIDFGWDVTKANNLRQASLRGNIGYRAERWSTNAYYNALTSNQDSVDKVSRDDAGLDFKYYFKRRWFGLASSTFLSNTEQKLSLRTTGKIGFGANILQTNAVYWNISTGATFNNEQYEQSSDNRRSLEGYIGTEINMFDTGDLSLLSKVGIYPSITESRRFRTDFNFDAKYDLPKDFYVRLGITLNYDNKPVEGASDTDYVFTTGFGWEL